MNKESLTVAGWVEIDLSALSNNVKVIKRCLRGNTQFGAVVKKNAYGHGLVPIAQSVVSTSVDYLAVYSLEEALELRCANITVPILVFGFIPPEVAKIVICAHLTPTVMTPELALALNSAAAELDTKVNVHVKVDTGLNRSGASFEDAANLLSFLFNLDHIEVGGLYTHFSSADELDKTPTETQLRRFLDLAKAFPTVKFLHAANSAATLRFPETHLNLVRVGIALYGLKPYPFMEKDIPLRPVLSLKGQIARIHRLRASEGVGYGLTWKAPNDALIALVPVGYGDGLPRSLSNRGEALVRGRRVPIRGIISMDQCILDITNIAEAHVGDEVTFIGSQLYGQITAEEVAKWANMINYEIVTRLPARLPRYYLSSSAEDLC